MPDKYELFLDKNKKVKLSADEQGNFFAEANDKRIKLGASGLENVDENGVASPVGADLTALSQSIIPDTNEVYDLGSAEKKFRHLYLSSNSLFVGDTKITSDPTTGALTTAVADSQGVFGAASAVGPENIAGAINTVNITKGITHNGTSGNLAPVQLTIAISPYNTTKVYMSGTAFNGATLETGSSAAGQSPGTELAFEEYGFRMQEGLGIITAFDEASATAYGVNWVIMPGNEYSDVANYGQEHADNADLRWYLTDDFGGGQYGWELRNKNTNLPVSSFDDVFLPCYGMNYSTGASEMVPGGISLGLVMQEWGHGNADFLPSSDYGVTSPMVFPCNVKWVENQANVTITGDLRMTFDGANYKLTRNSSSGAVETTAI